MYVCNSNSCLVRFITSPSPVHSSHLSWLSIIHSPSLNQWATQAPRLQKGHPEAIVPISSFQKSTRALTGALKDLLCWKLVGSKLFAVYYKECEKIQLYFDFWISYCYNASFDTVNYKFIFRKQSGQDKYRAPPSDREGVLNCIRSIPKYYVF